MADNIENIGDGVEDAVELQPIVDGLKKVAKFTSDEAKKTEKKLSDVKADIDGKLLAIEKKITANHEMVERGVGAIKDDIQDLSKRTSVFGTSSYEQDDLSAIKEALPERFAKGVSRYEPETIPGKGLLSDPRGLAATHAWFQLSTRLQMRAYDQDRDQNTTEFRKLNDRLEAIQKTTLDGQTGAQGGYTVPDIVAKGYRPSALRYLLLSSHYRKQLNFTWAGMDQAEESLRRIVDFLARLESATGDGVNPAVTAMAEKATSAFGAAIESDLNTAGALAAVFDLVREVNAACDARQVSAADAAVVSRAIEDMDRVLGVVSLRRAEDARPPVPVDEIERLIEDRRAARQRRDFAAADGIRVSLADRGVLLEDGPAGTRWKRK